VVTAPEMGAVPAALAEEMASADAAGMIETLVSLP